MLPSNAKVLLYTQNTFDPRADSAFAQCTSIVVRMPLTLFFKWFKIDFLAKWTLAWHPANKDPATHFGPCSRSRMSERSPKNTNPHEERIGLVKMSAIQGINPPEAWKRLSLVHPCFAGPHGGAIFGLGRLSAVFSRSCYSNQREERALLRYPR